ADAGGCSVLLPGARRVEAVEPGLAGWPRLHALLALVEPGPSPCWELARELRRVVLVEAGPPRLPAGVSISCTVSPLPDAGRGSLFSVAGCTVQPAARTHVESAA